MRSLRQDVRFGLRLITRSPGYAAVTVLTLALGIGANTAIFSLLDALVLRNLPVAHPEQLVEIAAVYRNGAKVPLSYSIFDQLQRNQRVFASVFGSTGRNRYNVETDRVLFPAEVRGVTGNFYATLGATPLLGRLIGPQDVAAIPAAPVAVIGYEFWERQFGRDTSVIGKMIRIEGEPFTIIGITRQWFSGMTPGTPPEITVPITAGQYAKEVTANYRLWIFGAARLKEGVSIAQAQAQLRSFWPEALRIAAPTQTPGQRLQSWLGMGLQVNSAANGINADLRAHFARPLYALMGLAALILLVACVNLANLTLSRAAARQREMSVRVALGASRSAIARQLLTETVLLSAVGALLAIAITSWGSQFLVRLMSAGADAPAVLDLRPDWRVFLFTAFVAIATGVLIGLSPAWQASREQPASVLRQNDRTLGSGIGRMGKALIITQIALSVVLLLGAGLLLRTLESLRSLDPQFERRRVLQVSLYPRPNGFQGVDVSTYRRQLIQRVATLPGVVSASTADVDVPVEDSGWKDTVSLTASDSSADAGRVAILTIISPGFLKTLGISLESGRDFDWSDDEHHPRVAIVDANLARRLSPSGNVLGMRVRFGVQPQFADMEIVGIARSARLIDARDSNAMVIYVPFPQHPSTHGNLFVRTDRIEAVTRTVQKEIEAAGHEYSTAAKTLEETNEQALLEERATATLSSLFAGLGLLLAGIGLFGLMSYTVTRRTREIGIRMALGSQRARILRMVLGESLLLSVAGIVIGAPFALLALRLITHLLFGVAPSDPLTFVSVASVLLAVGAVAGYWPARRAMNTDPAVALRHE